MRKNENYFHIKTRWKVLKCCFKSVFKGFKNEKNEKNLKKSEKFANIIDNKVKIC